MIEIHLAEQIVFIFPTERHSPADATHANSKMQCNLLYLVCINLLLIYERAVSAFTNDSLTTDDLLFDTTPLDLVDDHQTDTTAAAVTSERPPPPITDEPFNG